jgi:hypothetical protein
MKKEDLPSPIRLKGQRNKDRAIEVLLSLPVDSKKPVVVKFVLTDLTRSEKQKNLYFKWVGELAKGTGADPTEKHDHYKKGLVFDILKNRASTDELENPIYDMYQLLYKLWHDGKKGQAEELGDRLKNLVSTNFLTVEENTQVLRQVEMDAGFAGVTLTDPDGYRKSALGY